MLICQQQCHDRYWLLLFAPVLPFDLCHIDLKGSHGSHTQGAASNPWCYPPSPHSVRNCRVLSQSEASLNFKDLGMSRTEN